MFFKNKPASSITFASDVFNK